MSLNLTIIGLAQNFVGSWNSLPLLEARGQFGTRIMGGTLGRKPLWRLQLRCVLVDLRGRIVGG